MSETERPRAVVVDDSQFMRTVISEILEGGDIDVVDRARDGEDALRAIEEHHPDVVTMDVEMPGVDGIEAVERVMAAHPTPILMLSAHTEENADVTFDALERGAVDFFTKPGGEVSVEMTRFEDQLVEKVRSVARSDVSATEVDPALAETPSAEAEYADNPTLVIGASTGGPGIVERILTEFPLVADLRILVVQHMPANFTNRFATRLDGRSEYEVREATDGDVLQGGQVAVAPGETHLQVADYEEGRLHLAVDEGEPVNGVRPSIDVTMESAAATVDDPVFGTILTGMGNDGAAGVQAIKDAGGSVIVQDETSSAVFGMPKRAIETGCVDGVVPAEDVPAAILDLLNTEVATP